MKKLLSFVLLMTAVLFLLNGCAEVNEGAKEVGKPIGGVMRVPGSVAEGAAKGVAGEDKDNPYGR